MNDQVELFQEQKVSLNLNKQHNLLNYQNNIITLRNEEKNAGQFSNLMNDKIL